ncbi:MAG: S9 family peptidase [Thermomicrobiales bacterium]
MSAPTAETAPAILGYDEIADRLIPGDPQVSPDGRHVAFTVAKANHTGDGIERAIWLSRDRGPATRFTGGKATNACPRWSPDSSQLLFIANRDDKEKQGLYLLPLSGGEAQRLGELEGDLDEATWSPDGSKIAVLRTDPDTDAEKKRKDDKDDPVVHEEDVKRVRLWIVDAATGAARQLTFGDVSVWEYAWTPDGQHLVVITTGIHVVNEMFRKQSLWIIPVAGGIRTHLGDFQDGVRSPVIRARNGEQVVAVLAGERVDDPATGVWTIPLTGGLKTNVTKGFHGTYYTLIADPTDAAMAFAAVVEGTRQRLYRVSVETGAMTAITPANVVEHGSLASGPTVSQDGKTLAFGWTAMDAPIEIAIADLGADATFVTEFGKAFAGRLQPAERVTWESTDGVEIEGLLVRPKDVPEGTSVPLIVEIHGGPQWQWEDSIMLSWHDWAQMLASRGYAVLLPNPRGGTGRGSDFEKLLFGDVGGGEAQDVISGVKAMVERGIADPNRLGIGGWSWGGYLTAWCITQTDIFKAAVMGAGVANLISDHGAGDIAEANMTMYPGHPWTHWDLYAKGSPIRYATNVVTPTLIVHGENDIRVHPTQGQEYYRALKEVGVPVQFVRYPREGHSFRERAHQMDLMKRIVAWYEKYIPTKE